MTSVLYHMFRVCQALIFNIFVFFGGDFHGQLRFVGDCIRLLDVDRAAESSGGGESDGVFRFFVFGERNGHSFFPSGSNLFATHDVVRCGF